jgi:HlyD family secretion protein
VTDMNYDARIDTNTATQSAPYGLDDGDDALTQGSQRKLWIGGAAIVALLAGVYAYSHRSGGEAAKVNQAPLVTVAVPGLTSVEGTINVTGLLAAKHDMPIGVVGDGGTVVNVLVNAGDRVRAGQLLAIVDRQVQAQQQATSAANVAVSQADARIAQANLDRAQRLVADGFISKADIDKLTAVRDAAAARVRVSQAQLGEVGARMRRLNIVSPANGLLLDRNLEVGQVVSPGSGVLFRVADKGEMELKARLSETDLAKLAVGQKVQVTPVGSAQAYTGYIWQISPIIDPATRQGTARIALPYAPDIRPGGFASAAITSGTISAPLLPESALQADSQGSYVWALDKNNKAQRRRVKIAMVTDNGVAIAQGLSGQERIVLRAGAFLSEGETVQPRPNTQTGAGNVPIGNTALPKNGK